MILLGERHLRRAVNEYSCHYHTERNHQGFGNELVIRSETTATATGPVKCHERLGGLLRYYYRQAALGNRAIILISRGYLAGPSGTGCEGWCFG